MITLSLFACRCSVHPFLISLMTHRGSRSTQKQMPPRNCARCSTESRSPPQPPGGFGDAVRSPGFEHEHGLTDGSPWNPSLDRTAAQPLVLEPAETPQV